jgi:hypothetical protein
MSDEPGKRPAVRALHWLKRACVVLLILLGFYLLSAGPLEAIRLSRYSGKIDTVIETLYSPLNGLAEDHESFGRAFYWYVGLWMPLAQRLPGP